MVVLVLCVRRSAKREVLIQMNHELSDIISLYTKIKDKEVKEENA